MSNDDKRGAQHLDDLFPVELRLLIEKEQASIQHLKVTRDELLESLHNHQKINEDETFAHLTTTKRELYSTEQCIQELDHALQQVEQKDPQYLSKWLDSLELQTSNISFLVEAVDVLLKRTNKSVFERYKSTITNTITCADNWFDTLTRLINNIADRLERIKLNQVVIVQRQQHSEPEKVKEGEESLFFNSPPHVADTPYCATDTPFTERPLFSPSARPTSLDSPSFSSKIPTGLLASTLNVTARLGLGSQQCGQNKVASQCFAYYLLWVA